MRETIMVANVVKTQAAHAYVHVTRFSDYLVRHARKQHEGCIAKYRKFGMSATSRCTSTMKETRTHIMYVSCACVYMHGRPGVIFIYVLGEIMCLQLLPIEPDTRQSRKFQQQGFYRRERQSPCILVFPFIQIFLIMQVLYVISSGYKYKPPAIV